MTTPPPPLSAPDTLVCPNCGHVNPSWRSVCENCDRGLTADAVSLKITGKTPKPHANANGLCDKCNAQPGSPYTFHYLKRTGTDKTMKLSDYRDGGAETVTLCDKCVGQQRKKELAQFIFIIPVFLIAAAVSLWLFVSLLVSKDYFSALYLGSGLTCVVFAVGSIWYLNKLGRGGLQIAGVSLAMNLWKKWLTEQGFDTYLYEDEYAKLRSKK